MLRWGEPGWAPGGPWGSSLGVAAVPLGLRFGQLLTGAPGAPNRPGKLGQLVVCCDPARAAESPPVGIVRMIFQVLNDPAADYGSGGHGDVWWWSVSAPALTL